ncbi:ABC transporter permease [Pseudomonas sp. GX19020]|uniref:ABC transporter permease n=1 Tax=Pseudomonas sp. GX19020 TaxID=2942277 RepID=UPI002019DEBB|nr:ABC transporter permease [Pseudomonas sp. GX19020]MCL4064997.1 ABC transporter permease [Pseudomonas sp. GX19020]
MIRISVTVLVLLALWQGVILATGLPPFLLPSPGAVARALWTHQGVLATAFLKTLTETLAGFALGAVIGCGLALQMAVSGRLRSWLGPVVVVSQTIPIFALAPILTLWLGYGMAPKLAVVALVTFFPVASAFHDGLTRVPQARLDLARVMGAGRWAMLIRIRLPSALPDLATGLRLAAVLAPVGAVIGEWVGGSEGLGAVMLHANGRMRIDLVFASLALVVALSLGFQRLIAGQVAARLERYAG